MKRPLFTVGFIYLTAMTVAFFTNYIVSIAVIGILCFAMLMIVGDKTKFGKIVFTVLTTGMIALAVSVCFTVFRYAAVKSLDGKSIPIVGTIVNEKHYDKLHNYEVSTKIDGVAILGSNEVRVNLTTFERLDAEVGDAIATRFHMTSLPEITDNELYYLSNGILSGATLGTEPVIVIEPVNKLLSITSKMRKEFINITNNYVGNDRGNLVSALLFGDGQDIDNNVRQSFSKSGIAHVLAISGLHLAIVVHIMAGFITTILGRKKTAIVSIMIIWIFVFMGGMGYSLIRSGIMFTIYFIGELIGRESDGLSSLGFAAIIITTINPYSIGNLSMQLSFLSTFGILVLAPIIEKGIIKNVLSERLRNSQALRAIIKIFAITVAAQIPTAPIMILKFGFISLISPLTNLLVAPIIPVLIFIGLMTVISGAMGLVTFATLFGDITTFLTEIIINISDFLSSVPLATVYFTKSYIGIWFFFIVIGAIWVYMSNINAKAKKYLAIAAAFTLILGTTSEKLFDFNTVKILSTDGSRSVAIVKSNRAVVIGVPENKQIATKLINKLDSYGVDGIDLVVASDSDEVISGGANYLFTNKEVRYVVAPNDPYTTDYLDMVTKAKYIDLQNMQINMLDGVEGILTPDWGVDIKVNNNSVLKIFEDYDIMKSKNYEGLAIIDASGVPYMRKTSEGMRYLSHFGGNGEFILR